MKNIYVVGTADTKGEELAYLADAVKAAGGRAVIIDVGTRQPTIEPDVTAAEVARHGKDGVADALNSGDRGRAVAAMADAFARYAVSRSDIAGVVGIGGGGGTSIVTAGMRELPLGLPKIMVSTLASGDVAPYVGVSDIIMMPSITDMAGLNRISRVILANAAAAIVAMATRHHEETSGKPAIGLTMFGVTTTCVTAMVEQLKSDYDCLVFHATGTGGRTMEKLADSGLLAGVLDITTTEVCDLLFGGVLPAGEDRLDVIARTGLPYVGAPGALDMVNFWAPETIPEKYRHRLLYNHNSNVTLMRTTGEECRAMGVWIGRKLNACEGPVRFLIPEKGVSALDIEGGAFWNPEADAALFDALEATVIQTDTRRVQRLPLHINDPAFSKAAVAAFNEIRDL
ncbi:MAG: Tm-1-like ATP-binding domain-containing protein [Mesorhizobium sp.]|nr:Tm-1-like ATP-binding domain-containing protein [Mesorhizobium sp.]MBL8578216.1 Tm-1-like ATP-binding domain-containing protein [Mesorhizobium sp.]